MARKSKNFHESSVCITYKITDPEAYERLNLKRAAISQLQDMNLVQMTQYGFKEPVGRHDILKQLEDKGDGRYVYPSWLIPGAKRFIVEGLLTGLSEVYQGAQYSKIKTWCIDDPQNYLIYVTDVPLPTEAEANKAQRAIEKLERQKATEEEKRQRKEEQKALRLRKQDLDNREKALNAKQRRIYAELGEVATQIAKLQADVSEGIVKAPKIRKITIQRKAQPTVTVSSGKAAHKPVELDESLYMKGTKVDNEKLSNLLLGYMLDMGRPVTLKEMYSWISTYCPKAVARWASVDKGVANLMQNYLRKENSIHPTGNRGEYAVN